MSGSRCVRPKDAATAPDALPPADVPQFTVGETVRMRKAHPCGADAWTVTRVGGDVGFAAPDAVTGSFWHGVNWRAVCIPGAAPALRTRSSQAPG